MISDLFTIPAVAVLLGAFVLPLLPRRTRSAAFIAFPLAALVLLWMLPAGDHVQIAFATYELHPLKVDALSRIFGVIFAIITVIGGVYAYHLKKLGQQCAALAYAGGAIGVTFAGDFFSLYIFWEIMAVSSVYLVWARRTPSSRQAGMRYLLVHFFGGGLLFTGILLHLSNGGSLMIQAIEQTYTASNVLMLLGFSLNAAIPPLHAWLADAYPKATVTGAVFMSAFTTKSAVYILMRVFPGWDILIGFGVMMALYGVVYAVLANDIREILAYHIISQVGYMVAGVGIGTEMALNGAAAHAFSHILYKSLLFMGAGAVLYSTGKSKLTELGGFARKMPWVVGLYMIGAFSISGFPLFNGFISKSMVISAAGKAHYEWGTLLLLLASVGTFLHTGLKLPYFTWFGTSKSEITVSAVPRNMLFGMGIGAFLCTLFGVYPSLLYRYLPYPVDYHPYTAYHLVETTQILVFTFIGFWLLRGKLKGEPTLALDTDWFYRRPARLAWRVFVDFPAYLFTRTENLAYSVAGGLARFSRNPLYYFKSITGSRTIDIESDDYTAPIHAALGFILLSIIIATLILI